MTALAYSRPFWPLFLHVLGAMLLFGAVLAAALTAYSGHRRASFQSLLVAVPAYVLLRVGAQWIYSKEGWSGHNDPTWLGIGFAVSDMGLLVLLLALGVTYWWLRSGKQAAARIAAGLSTVYLLLLALAWLAMSGKWG